MTDPRLFTAPRTGGTLLRYDEGNTDAGAAYDLLAETEFLAPGGIGGEAVFYRLFVALTHAAAANLVLRVTPIVRQLDHATEEVRTVEKAAIDVTVPASAATRRTVTMEIALSEAYQRGGVDRFRTAFRGEAIAFRIETTTGVPAGAIILERIGVERETVLDTKGAKNES